MQAGEDDGILADDGTGDTYADWPGDSNIDFSNVSIFVKTLRHILARSLISTQQFILSLWRMPSFLQSFCYPILPGCKRN